MEDASRYRCSEDRYVHLEGQFVPYQPRKKTSTEHMLRRVSSNPTEVLTRYDLVCKNNNKRFRGRLRRSISAAVAYQLDVERQGSLWINTQRLLLECDLKVADLKWAIKLLQLQGFVSHKPQLDYDTLIRRPLVSRGFRVAGARRLRYTSPLYLAVTACEVSDCPCHVAAKLYGTSCCEIRLR